MTALVIAARFCGPPGCGNGGYVCGRIAAYLDGPATVTLRRPPPLATPMTVERDRQGAVRVLAGDALVAEGASAPDSPALELPGPVPLAEARAAGTRCRLRVHPDEHPFPACFVCGPDRARGDGLHIMVGPVAGRDLSADVWCPDETLAGSDGYVRPEFVWAALDCAGGVALHNAAPGGPPFLLGQLSARQLAPVRAGQAHVVAGWRLAQDGRKLTAGSALFTADGQVAAVARATWIRARPPEPARALTGCRRQSPYPVTIIQVMTTIPLADAKARLSAVLDEVRDTHDRVVITRNGRPEAVIMSVSDLESLEETLDLLSTPGALDEIRSAEAEIARGEAIGTEELRRLMEERIRAEQSGE